MFLFKTRQQLIAGMKLVRQRMARFGLEIHIVREVNRKTKPSKTECVFFPPPQFFANLIPSLGKGIVVEEVISKEGIPSEDNSDAIQEAQETARVAKEDDLYDQLEETQQFDVANRFMKFCKLFKYIGSYVYTTFATTTVLKFTSLMSRSE